MKTIRPDQISDAVAKLCMDANYNLGKDVLQALKNFKEKEESPVGKELLDQCIVNAKIAHDEKVPMCQDTGFAVVFVEIGQEVHLMGGSLREAIEEGVRQGYQEGYLRKSVCHPFTRQNTGDNTPAIIHVDLVPGRVQVVQEPLRV